MTELSLERKRNFALAQEYYDFIEYLQNKFGKEAVYQWQEEFGGSFTKPSKDDYERFGVDNK